jgi:glycosidase
MHSVMNYPLADAILRFALHAEAEQLAETVLSLLEHYPPCVVDGLMNHIGTHDTPRILTRLSGDKSKLKLCAALQFTLPGNPCVYYGDEAGLRGAADPFNRGCFPWGKEDEELLGFYRELGKLRRRRRCFAGGAFRLISAAQGCVAFRRALGGDAVTVVANANPHEIHYRLPDGSGAEVEAASALIIEDR